MSVLQFEVVSRQHAVDDQGYRSYVVTYEALTDDPDTGPLEVLAAGPAIVQWLTPYSTDSESDPYALAQSVSVNQGEEKFKWTVAYTFSTKSIDGGSIANPLDGGSPPGLGSSPSPPSSPSQPGSQSPAARPWSLHYGVDLVQQAAPPVDTLGTPVKASNGQPYTGLQYDVALPYFELTIPRLTADRSKRLQYMNKVNSDTFFGYAPGTLRVGDYDIQSQYEQEWGYYYQIKLKFYERQEGHVTTVLDEGTYWKTGTDIQKNQDKWSNPVDGSVLLDGAGNKLPDGDDPVTNEFLFYSSIAYANIL